MPVVTYRVTNPMHFARRFHGCSQICNSSVMTLASNHRKDDLWKSADKLPKGQRIRESQRRRTNVYYCSTRTLVANATTDAAAAISSNVGGSGIVPPPAPN